MRRTEDPLTQILICLGAAALFIWLMTAGRSAFPQTPTPTPGTPEEWSTWLDDQPDVETIPAGDYDPVETYAGTYSAPRLWIKQSLTAGVAVEIEWGYTEARSPIDPSKIGGLQCQGEQVTELVDPVMGAGPRPRPTPNHPGPRPTPDHPGPGPRPTRPPEMRPVPGGDNGQGRIIADVIFSDREFPGAERRQARRVSGVRLTDPIEGPVEVKKTPWHSSYAVRSGPVWVRVEVAE